MQFTKVSIAETVNSFMSCEDRITDANALYKAYLASIRGNKWKESTQLFMMRVLGHIFDIQDALRDRTLTNGEPNEFILHERGKTRAITSIPLRDRIVRHALCDEVLLPAVRRKIIYDNGASLKGRGVSFQRKRFEIHLHQYIREHGTDGWILFGDFSKFYDNIHHEIAKRQLLSLVDHDAFVAWLLDVIFQGFEVDVSGMTGEECDLCMESLFDKLEYRRNSKRKKTGEKKMAKSVNIGDQLSQVVGIYYPNRIDTYVKYVRSQKYYGRHTDDWYLMNPSKEELLDILEHVRKIAGELGIHINEKKTRIVRMDRRFTFLQVRYKVSDSGKITKRMVPARMTAMKRKLKKLSKKVRSGETDYDRVEEMFKSWMGNFYRLMTRSQRRGFIELYERLFDKQVEISKGKMTIRNREVET